MLTKRQYLTGTQPVPRMLQADAYTVGSGPHVSPDAKEFSLYHVVPRRGMLEHAIGGVAHDDRIIFYGLRRILRDLLSCPISMWEIETTEKFLNTFHAGGTPFWWDRGVWDRVVNERGGILPIKIEAMRAGTACFPYEPVMQITAEDGFGELANYFESTLLKVWATSERVTSAAWWKLYLQDRCRQIHPNWDEDSVQFATSIMCHDFGDRAGACVQESEVLGQAHVMVFPGTDTMAGAYLDWADTKEPHACSIHALAHRTVMGYQYETQAHAALYHLGKVTGITAHVSDTYDFKQMVVNWCKRLAEDPEWSQDGNVVVLRPDSGDPVDCVLHILRTAASFGLMEKAGEYLVSKRVRWIQGDSMDYETMNQVIEACIENKFSPFGSGAFGVGGWLRNSIARDHTGLSMKLAAVGKDKRPVCKKSDTPAKSSIPGEVEVLGHRDDYTVWPAGTTEGNNLLEVWYDGREVGSLEDAFHAPCLEDNAVVRKRIAAFMDRPEPEKVLSPEIEAQRDRILSEQSKALQGGW